MSIDTIVSVIASMLCALIAFSVRVLSSSIEEKISTFREDVNRRLERIERFIDSKR